MKQVRGLSVLAYLVGFACAWRCWAAASEPAKALGWLTAASLSFWLGRMLAALARDRR